jgi:hypothetical protein
LTVDVSIVISSHLTDNDYDHVAAVGAMAETLDQCVRVLDHPGANELAQMTPSGIVVEHFRPADKDTQIHSMVSATFTGIL